MAVELTRNHAERAHALLSASASARWLACTPSAKLESACPNTTSAFAAEGTLAHEFAELYLRAEMKYIGCRADKSAFDTLRANTLYQPEMEEHARDYAAYIYSKINDPDASVDIESRLDFSQYVPGGFGTGDCVICQNGTLTIVDFKYGKGVKVSAEHNSQLMLYALGAVENYDFAYDFDSIEMCIFQPRIDNISEWKIDRAGLTKWAEETLKPRATLAAEGKGDLKPGVHCQFCKIRAQCKALADYCLETVKTEFQDESGNFDANKLTPSDYASILARLDVVEKWIRTVRETALNSLLDNPGAIPGWKVVEGRSVRQYRSVGEVAEALHKAEMTDEQIYKPRELLGITDMTKLLGKKKFAEVLGALIIKPQGKPAVAPASDKRPAYQPEKLENEFEIEEESA